MVAEYARRGLVRLLNSADGRVLCLAGEVDARSVTGLSPAARELVHNHLAAAERAGRPVALRAVSREEHAPSPAPPRR